MGKSRRIITDQRLEAQDKVFMHYADLGPRSADKVVLMLHGMFSTADMWGAGGTCDALLDLGYRCIMPDMRGNGQTTKLYDSFQYGNCIIQDLLKLLDHLNLEKVHIVGYSIGAETALYFAAYHQDRVKTVCIGGSGWGDAHHAEVYKSFGKCCGTLPGVPCGCNLICWARFIWYPCCCPLCCYAIAGCSPDLKAQIAMAEGHGRDLLDIPEEKVKSIKVPFLGSSGLLDPELKYTKRMEGVIQQAEFEYVPGVAHEAFGQCPEFQSIIVKFLEEQHKPEGKEGSDAVISFSPPPQVEMTAPGSLKS